MELGSCLWVFLPPTTCFICSRGEAIMSNRRLCEKTVRLSSSATNDALTVLRVQSSMSACSVTCLLASNLNISTVSKDTVAPFPSCRDRSRSSFGWQLSRVGSGESASSFTADYNNRIPIAHFCEYMWCTLWHEVRLSRDDQRHSCLSTRGLHMEDSQLIPVPQSDFHQISPGTSRTTIREQLPQPLHM